ncbi:methyltransferase domain-containing protein [Nonomuraea sp. NN258]|uniref:methyltransferase n=1 Tax=Nonomuraea antri TaxID=2730852 RepID=UPI0015699187|nr:methyltransferase [Nonomuraea antri]NRQ35011.1 methyltransferase domain-containing protein [Nonomuraea antri]
MTDDPSAPVLELIRGVWRFSALHVLARLGVAEALRGGPLTATQIAGRCDARPELLARVLRAAAGFGLLRSVAPGTYELTEAGEVLLPDHPRSLHAGVLTTADPALMYSLLTLPETVATGRRPFVARYGPLYRHLATDKELGELFDAYMDLRSRTFARALAETYDFSQARSVVDVGGGKGHILATVLRTHPHLSGTVFELAHLAPAARACLAERGVADRADVVTGDFFASVPVKADVYLLSNVLHNWDDAEAARIIGNVLTAMPPRGRILFLDMILPDDDSPHLGKDLDMRMLGVFGSGGERTRAEYTRLLERAGLSVAGITELAASTSLIEAMRAE